jgi:hypothetical protein
MKHRTRKWMIAAASLLVATGVASAQAMRADVPFAFRAGNTMLAPGTYRVQLKDSGRLVILSNLATRESVLLLPTSAEVVPGEWKSLASAIMAFRCGAGQCALAQVWPGTELMSLTFHDRSPGRDERAALTLVRMVRTSLE